MSNNIPLFQSAATIPGIQSRGVSVKILNFAIQKGICQNDISIAGWAITEWLGFEQWRDPKAEDVLKYLKHRIQEILPLEDCIAFSQPWLLIKLIELFKHWESEQYSSDAGRFIYYGIELLCNSRKCQLANDINAQFGSAIPLHKYFKFLPEFTFSQSILAISHFINEKQHHIDMLKRFLEESDPCPDKIYPTLFSILQKGEFHARKTKKKDSKNEEQTSQNKEIEQNLQQQQLPEEQFDLPTQIEAWNKKIVSDARKRQWELWKETWMNLRNTSNFINLKNNPKMYETASLFLNYLEELFFTHPTLKERFLFIVHAVLFVSHLSKLEWDESVFISSLSSSSTSSSSSSSSSSQSLSINIMTEDMWKKHLANHKLSGIPQFISDMIQNQQQGGPQKLRKVELLQSALSTSLEDKEFYNPNWRAILHRKTVGKTRQINKNKIKQEHEQNQDNQYEQQEQQNQHIQQSCPSKKRRISNLKNKTKKKRKNNSDSDTDSDSDNDNIKQENINNNNNNSNSDDDSDEEWQKDKKYTKRNTTHTLSIKTRRKCKQ